MKRRTENEFKRNAVRLEHVFKGLQGNLGVLLDEVLRNLAGNHIPNVLRMTSGQRCDKPSGCAACLAVRT